MKRLTKNVGDRYIANDIKLGHRSLIDSVNKHSQKVYNKLGRFEDIEELCEKIRKAKKIYFVDIYGNIHKENIEDAFVGYDTKYDVIIVKHGGRSPDSYGKTWALAKNELERQKMIKKGFLTDKPIY